jgi:hypothetical protein
MIFDAGATGFGIRVTRTGRKIFIAQARSGKQVRRVAVGTYPDITVKQARDAASDVVRDIRAGRDPRVEKAARAKAIEAGATTVKMFSERWLAEVVRPKRKPRTLADYERLLEQKIIPELGHLVIERVTKEDVLKLHLAMQKTPRRANYTVSTFRAMMT